ncbi:spore protease YyaC [Vulcanibacillus modesticaldus]|uniref:Spore protease YyaC n=1 Tax=Vulcanibacillus modesticaldus TaxID=337097 RepID=A0A1D2YVM7_9BACI|nr:spore protease YyaC [Vulcanibacillus modesticaldus]OEF99676.1 spore protease YyaC [Vulcanibacillus modesticaldus]
MSFLKKVKNLKYVIDSSEPNANIKISNHINEFINKYPFEHWVVVCIGTDRSTGDALGPLVGSKLKLIDPYGFTIIGSLEEPVHALNLKDTIQFIDTNYPNSGVISIDASLGQLSSVGTIQIQDGPLKPGAGVSKDLPEIGHFHITGIVNIGGFMEYFVLQNTRLSLVMKMSEQISSAISRISIVNKTKKENAINN